MARAAEKEGDELYEIKIQRASRFYRPRATTTTHPRPTVARVQYGGIYNMYIVYIYMRGVRPRLPVLLTTSLALYIIL